jgi:hypothetical protein
VPEPDVSPAPLLPAIAGREFVAAGDAFGDITLTDGGSPVGRMTPVDEGAWAWRAETRGRSARVAYERSSWRERLRWSWRVVASDARSSTSVVSCTPRTWGIATFDITAAPGYRLVLRRSRLTDDDGALIGTFTGFRTRRFVIATEMAAGSISELALVLLVVSAALLIDPVAAAPSAGAGG